MCHRVHRSRRAESRMRGDDPCCHADLGRTHGDIFAGQARASRLRRFHSACVPLRRSGNQRFVRLAANLPASRSLHPHTLTFQRLRFRQCLCCCRRGRPCLATTCMDRTYSGYEESCFVGLKKSVLRLKKGVATKKSGKQRLWTRFLRCRIVTVHPKRRFRSEFRENLSAGPTRRTGRVVEARQKDLPDRRFTVGPSRARSISFCT